MLWVLVYVDDVVFIGSFAKQLQQFVNGMYGQFSLKDMGDLSFFLGITLHSYIKGYI